MPKLAYIRLLTGVLAIMTMITYAMPAMAQVRNPDGTPNPTASVLDEQTLLKEVPRIEGRIDIPNDRESVLVQPAGRTWDYFHEVVLRWFGTMVIIGMIVVLAIGYFALGRLRISAGRSGERMMRFNGFERFCHWLTAVSFVILGLTGLNMTFGKTLLMPLVGPNNFSAFSQVSKYVHNFVSFAFLIGLALIVALWVRDNIPRGRSRVVPARRWLHQIEARARRPLQCWRKARLLGGIRRRHCHYRVWPAAAVSILLDGHRRHADRPGCACGRCHAIHRLDPWAHLRRHPRHGGGVRGHG